MSDDARCRIGYDRHRTCADRDVRGGHAHKIDQQRSRSHFTWESTVAEQRAHNPHVKDDTTEAAFVAFRTARDATLATPTLLLPSMQVNICRGRLPEAEADGLCHLKIPVKVKGGLQ